MTNEGTHTIVYWSNDWAGNGTVYAQSKDAVGNISNVISYTVSNIDKTKVAILEFG